MLDYSGYSTFDGTFSSAGVPTGVAITASAASTNAIDLLSNPSTSNAARDVGAGYPLGIHVDITVAFATLTSLQVELDVSPDNTNWFQIMLSPVYPAADLIIGAPIFRYAMPPEYQGLFWVAGVGKINPRYLRLFYTVAGSNATVGKVFSYMTPLNDRKQFSAITPNYSVTVDTGEI